MLHPISRVLGVAGALAIVAGGYMLSRAADERDAAQLPHIAPAASDALVQAIDLSHIASFRYVNDSTLEVTDETGKNFKMELTEPCPGIEGARDISLVTESYRDLDKFTAIAVKGSVCTFKDFAPLPVGALPAPAPSP